MQFIVDLVVMFILCVFVALILITFILLPSYLNKKYNLWRIKYMFTYKKITRCKKCGRLEHDPWIKCDECKAPFYLYYEIAKLPNGQSHGTIYDNWNAKEIVLAKWYPFHGWKIKEVNNAI